MASSVAEGGLRARAFSGRADGGPAVASSSTKGHEDGRTNRLNPMSKFRHACEATVH